MNTNMGEIYIWIVVFCVLILLIFIVILQSYKRKKERELHSVQAKIEENERLLSEYRSLLESIRSEKIRQTEILSLHERQDTLVEYLMEQFEIYKKLKLASGNYNMQEKDWLELTLMMDMLYDNFATRLQEIYPSLTQDAIRFCCLVRLKLPMKSLTGILHVDSAAIYKRRYRLKKDLMPSEENGSLDDFLLSF